MRTVAMILQQKGHDVWSISPKATVFEALRLMAEKNVGALLVVQEDQCVGIVSERDYARKVVLHGRSSRNTPVGKIMTKRVFYVQPQQTLDECMALMTEKRIRHLPVISQSDLVGVISIGDVVKHIIDEQGNIIEHLEGYIVGSK